MIKDLTETFRKGIEISAGYNAENIRKELEKFPYIECNFDEDGNFLWYYIYLSDGKDIGRTLIESYGWLSRYFPVAILKKNCPEYIRNFLEKNNIIIDNFIDNISYSCEENILKQYFYNDYIHIIDDRKLITGEISFNSKEFDYITYGDYITPYNFDFYNIIRI